MKLLKCYILTLLLVNVINGKLRKCPTNVTKTVICTNNEDHEVYRFIMRFSKIFLITLIASSIHAGFQDQNQEL